MAASDTSTQAFEAAMKEFRNSLQDDRLYKDILRIDSIDKLYEAIEQLQRSQDGEGRIRRLRKMGSILEKFEAFGKVVDTFVQVQPEIMALVWGSIRFLLVFTDRIPKSADAVVAAMEQIKDALPYLTDAANMFNNHRVKEKLALFYGDILQFHVIAVKFFKMTKLELVLQSTWPTQKDKLDVIVSQIDRHKALMRDEITFQHLWEENEHRVKTLRHFDQETEFQNLQKFNALQSRVAPGNYDDRLDWLLNRISEGSEKWLINDRSFLDWLDMSNSSAHFLWLHGIPGSGKTYLSAATIKEVRKHHRTLFVFTSHIQRRSTTARSIMHSLLFQLASVDHDTRSVLIGSDEQHIVGSTSKISQISKTVLEWAGPTCIILDGLDEMESDERGILLKQLFELDGLTQVKIFVSSRTEDDIGKCLEKRSSSILVHKKNSASIQSYVNRRVENWIDSQDFVQSVRQRIQHLLAPLAANAAGMFLYARIILDNVDQLTNLEEIERELKVLPETLDDVYCRIFERINNLPLALQRKAKMIFNCIAFGPVLMTQHEIEQILDIASSSDPAPRVSALKGVNFVGICGAVVEVVDESPRFVHFTVKEYILEQQAVDFGNKVQANFSLAKCTLKYLCSGIFDESLSNSELEDHIVAGKYRLHLFAFTQWIELIRSCVEGPRNLRADQELHELLCQLARELTNCRFEGTVSHKDTILRDIERKWPEVADMVYGVSQFRQDNSQTDWNYSNHREWINNDPSIMSLMWARIYERFAALLCSEGEHRKPMCRCETLKRHYGTRIYKCSFPSCSLSRRGFETHKARDVHIDRDNHSRPWKCRYQGCDYAVIGFSTSRGADNHWQKRHQVSNPNPAQISEPGTSDELQVLLFELTKAGDVEEIQNLTANMAPDVKVSDWMVSPAILLAATTGSLPLVKTLYEWSKCWPKSSDFYSAIMTGENTELLVWFLEKLLISKFDKFSSYGWLGGEAVATSSPDMYTAWEDFMFDIDRGLKVAYSCYTEAPCEVLHNGAQKAGHFAVYRKWYIPSSMKEHHDRSVLFSSSSFFAAKDNPFLEYRLIQTWQKLVRNVLGGRPLDKRFLGYALVCLAKSSNPSTILGEELLRLGAPIDFPRGAGLEVSDSEEEQMQSYVFVKSDEQRGFRQKRQKGMTALHHAAKKTTERAAHFVCFLLENGASPEYGWDGKKPADERGAALMKKWLGESWQEVEERTKEARLEKKLLTNLHLGEAIDDSEDENCHDSEVRGKNQDDGENEGEHYKPRRRSFDESVERDAKRQKLVRAGR